MKKLTLALLLCTSLAWSQTVGTNDQKTDKPADTKKAPAKKDSGSTDVTASSVVHKGAWDLGVWAEGGSGVGKRSSTQFVMSGFRFGRVMTGEHGGGWVRGNFEMDADIIPVFMVMQPVQNAYGFSFNPLVLKWNFTSGKRILPYAELTGGALFTNNNVPVGTNTVNFTPQGGFGMHMLVGNKKQAVTWNIKYMHVSNASLANANSGINAAVIFGLGYTWFK